MARKRAAFITIGESPRPDILDEMRPWWDGSSLDIEEHGALDGLSREEIARASPKAADDRLVSRLHDGTEVLLEAAWAHQRVEDLVRRLDDGGIDIFVLLCTGHFHGLADVASEPGPPPREALGRGPGEAQRAKAEGRRRKILVAAGPVVDHGLAAIAESATSIGVLLPNEGQKSSFRCEPAASRRFILSHASPYSPDSEVQWEMAARELEEADLVVMHCMGYTEPMRGKLAQKTGKPVLLARRMVAAAVAQLL